MAAAPPWAPQLDAMIQKHGPVVYFDHGPNGDINFYRHGDDGFEWSVSIREVEQSIAQNGTPQEQAQEAWQSEYDAGTPGVTDPNADPRTQGAIPVHKGSGINVGEFIDAAAEKAAGDLGLTNNVNFGDYVDYKPNESAFGMSNINDWMNYGSNYMQNSADQPTLQMSTPSFYAPQTDQFQLSNYSQALPQWAQPQQQQAASQQSASRAAAQPPAQKTNTYSNNSGDSITFGNESTSQDALYIGKTPEEEAAEARKKGLSQSDPNYGRRISGPPEQGSQQSSGSQPRTLAMSRPNQNTVQQPRGTQARAMGVDMVGGGANPYEEQAATPSSYKGGGVNMQKPPDMVDGMMVSPGLQRNSALGANQQQSQQQSQGLGIDDRQWRSGQMNLASNLWGTMQGEGPSLAEMQLRQGQDQSVKNALALANSNPGMSPAAAMRQAQQSAEQSSMQTNQQAGQMRAQEAMQARGELANLMQGARATDVGIESQQAQMAQQASQTNLAAAMQQQQQRDSMVQYFTSMGMSAQQAQMQAQIELEKMKQQQSQFQNQYNMQKAQTEAGIPTWLEKALGAVPQIVDIVK